jgi:transglutaminase-like putative cysteine protease
MLIRLGYDIRFELAQKSPFVALLSVHPSRAQDLREPDELQIEPETPVSSYIDAFGNRCHRFAAASGEVRLRSSTLVQDSGEPDPQNPSAKEIPVEELPPETLQYLIASRYCEVDLFPAITYELFGHTPPGWQRVQAVCDWVHAKVAFGYNFARSNKTALDVYTERLGVCRDFQHLAITFCRALNIPARYATGYLGDIGVPAALYPMDFSAWFETYLDGKWWTFDARHNKPRIGRVLIAVGRDAADVAITTSFGKSNLKQFTVVTDEVSQSAPVETAAASS